MISTSYMKNYRELLLITSLGILFAFNAYSQVSLKFDYGITNQITPDLDSNRNVTNLTELEYWNLVTRMHAIDQKYRVELREFDLSGNKNSTEEKAITKKLMVNDKVNVVLLKKLLKLYGWPKNTKPYGGVASKAMTIAIHASRYPLQDKEFFYAQAKLAFKKGLLNKKAYHAFFPEGK